MKTCAKCRIEKPLDDFHHDRSRRDGRQPYCKDCHKPMLARLHPSAKQRRIYARRWRDRHPGVVAAQQSRYRERHRTALAVKQRDYYRRNPEKVKAYNKQWVTDNRPRVLEYHRRRRERLGDIHRAYQAAWSKAHPEVARATQQRRRARRRAALIIPFTKAAMAQRLSMFGGCWICGGVATVVDHVKPLAKGGAHMLANLRPACGPCNVRKGDRWPFESMNVAA